MLDLVGNHRRANARLALLGVTRDEVTRAPPGTTFHRRWDDGREVVLSPEAIDAVKAVEKAITGPRERLRAATRDLCEGGVRATLAEVLSRTGLSASTVAQLFGSWLGLLEAADALTEDDRRLAASSSAASLLLAIEKTEMSGPHKMILLGAMASRWLSKVTVREGAKIFWEHLETQHPEARRFFVDSKTGAYNGPSRAPSEIPRKFPMEVLAKKAALFTLGKDAFEIRIPGDVSPSLVFDAIVERAEARLYGFLRSRASEPGDDGA